MNQNIQPFIEYIDGALIGDWDIFSNRCGYTEDNSRDSTAIA
jgi:hypothetical protein